MKRFFLALVASALANTAWAQTPTQPQALVTILPVSHGQVSAGPACANNCCDTACVATKTICVSEPAIKKVTKINYSSTCEKVCFPGPGKLFSFLHSSCDTCEQGNCQNAIYTKKVLIKKVCVTECPTFKCVAVTVPACESSCGAAQHCVNGPATAPVAAPPAEKIIMRPMPLPKN